jgi:phage tail-like protein
MSCSTPDVSVGTAMYKEGTMLYERKYPGETSMGGDLSLERGVARGDSAFWTWIRTVIEGTGEYRADLKINHYHRSQALSGALPADQNKLHLDVASPARIYHVYECFPTSHNVTGGQLAATDGEISVMSLTIAYEHFFVEDKPATP